MRPSLDMLRYGLTKAAANDLRSIARYTVKNFGTIQARLYADGLTACFEMITDNPALGRAYDHIRPGLRHHDHKSHAVFYMQNNQGILILRVLHFSQDTTRHL